MLFLSKMDVGREEKLIARLSKEIETLENHECHTRGQTFHDSKQQQVLAAKQAELTVARSNHQELGSMSKFTDTEFPHSPDLKKFTSILKNLKKLF